jgi:hypothetical protein
VKGPAVWTGRPVRKGHPERLALQVAVAEVAGRTGNQQVQHGIGEFTIVDLGVEVVKIGIAMFPNVDAPAPGRLGRMIEDRGLESLWFAEHSHLPVEVQPAWGGERGNRYAKTFDPFVAMIAASAATTTLKIATGVCLVPQRDPIHTAEEVATVDVLSDGRVIFGVGAGWNRQEMRNHGTDPKIRIDC